MKNRQPKKLGRPRGDAPSLPVYPSMLAVEGATGIPVAVQKQAKAAGCNAFDSHGRVDLGLLLRWLFSQDADGEANTNWGNRLKRALTLIKEIDLQQKQGLMVNKSEVLTAMAKIHSVLWGALDRMRHEGPPDWKGRDETEIYERFGKSVTELKSELNLAFEKLEKGDVGEYYIDEQGNKAFRWVKK